MHCSILNNIIGFESWFKVLWIIHDVYKKDKIIEKVFLNSKYQIIEIPTENVHKINKRGSNFERVVEYLRCYLFSICVVYYIKQ